MHRLNVNNMELTPLPRVLPEEGTVLWNDRTDRLTADSADYSDALPERSTEVWLFLQNWRPATKVG